MTLTFDQRPTSAPDWSGVSGLLASGLNALDITADEHDLVVYRYGQVASVLDEVWESTRGSNHVFPQGSFRLGTVTRRISDGDDIDIDLVAVRDILKTSISQSELKEEVGRALYVYASRPESGYPLVSESDRCWTLSWPGMHMDVLPAIPEAEAGKSGLLITDHALHDWQHSHPVGYADWFASRMLSEFTEQRAALAKSLQVDDVPTWRVKTSLQRSVQALKRHRDIYFEDRPADRPASIIITTLAAKAYRQSGPLLKVLRGITSDMPRFIVRESGGWFLPNPVEPDENFADYWNVDSSLAGHFAEWMEVAERDFAELSGTTRLDRVAGHLEKSFGSKVSEGALRGMADDLNQARASRSVSISASTGAVLLGGEGSPLRSAKSNSFFGGTGR
jgi:hypothetical protein